MRKLVALGLAGLLAAALMPHASAAGKKQKVEGGVLIATPYTDDTCFFGLHRRARLVSQGLFPVGVVGYDFEADPKTVGKKFTLKVTGGSGVDLDISFYTDLGDMSDPGGAPANSDFANRKEGGETGTVPPGFPKALICMYAGSNATFTYTAG